MMAMMTHPEDRNYIEFSEICDFFFKSWVHGYKHVGWQVKRDKSKKSINININLELYEDSNILAPTITQFELWAKKYESNVHQAVKMLFNKAKIDIMRPIDIDTFKNLILGEDISLKITYTIKTVRIATSLVGLDQLSFDDSQGDSIPSSGSQFIRYPTLK
jgi:hypothetical protein